MPRAPQAPQAPSAPGQSPVPGQLLIDISPLITEDLPVWPGDTPFRLRHVARLDDGDGITIGGMETTFHVGAHTDAHCHYRLGAPDVAQMPLDAYYGPCQVINVRTKRGARFGLDDLEEEPGAPRILLKTGTFPDPMQWNQDFAAPEPALIDILADRGVRLVGFDTPSTDPMTSKDLPSHQRLVERGMVNLEGLDLRHVEPGHYTLIALPLRIKGADASPVRAVLVA